MSSSKLVPAAADPAPPATAAPAKTRPALGRILAQTAAVLGITGGLTLVLLEIGLRLFAPQITGPIPGLFVADPATRYRLLPGARVAYHYGEIDTTYNINSQGLRMDAPMGPLAAGTTRLLALGDSFTFGSGVASAQAFPQLLNGVQAAEGSRVETINAGVPGYGPDNEAAWLQTYGWPLQPKIVVLAFFVGNDVRDAMLGMNKTTVDAQGRLVESDTTRDVLNRGDAPADTGLKGWLEQNSHAFVFLRGLYYRLTTRPVPPQPGQFVTGPYEGATFYRQTETPLIAAGWITATQMLDAIRADVTAHGAQLLVVAIPAREQVHDSDWQDLQSSLGLAAADLDRDRPQRTLAEWSARTGTPLLDLLPPMRDAGAKQRLYFHTDPHWNAAGQALAAQLIRARLAEMGLLRP